MSIYAPGVWVWSLCPCSKGKKGNVCVKDSEMPNDEVWKCQERLPSCFWRDREKPKPDDSNPHQSRHQDIVAYQTSPQEIPDPEATLLGHKPDDPAVISSPPPWPLSGVGAVHSFIVGRVYCQVVGKYCFHELLCLEFIPPPLPPRHHLSWGRLLLPLSQLAVEWFGKGFLSLVKGFHGFGKVW